MTMPAGRYYIGDLCYVMTDTEWEEFCSLTIKENMCLDGEFTFKDGRRFATYGTAWGDGVYHDQYGREYPVDAGLIGCIKVDDIIAKKYDDIEELGNISDFGVEFSPSGGRGMHGWNGVIRFGSLQIKTGEVDEYGDE